MDWRRKKEGLARGYDRSTSDSKEAPVLRATPQCSNSIDYCCRCTSYPAFGERQVCPDSRSQASERATTTTTAAVVAAVARCFVPATFHVRKFVRGRYKTMLMRLQVRLLDPAFSSISSDAACISVHLILVKKDIAFA